MNENIQCILRSNQRKRQRPTTTRPLSRTITTVAKTRNRITAGPLCNRYQSVVITLLLGYLAGSLNVQMQQLSFPSSNPSFPNIVHASSIFSTRNPQHRRRCARETILRSIPAVSVYECRVHDRRNENEEDKNFGIECASSIGSTDDKTLVEVSVKMKETQERGKSKSRHAIQTVASRFSSKIGVGSGGFYYGLSQKSLQKNEKKNTDSNRSKPPRLQDSVSEAVDELRSLRRDIERMRQEIKEMRVKILGVDDDDENEVRGDGLAPVKTNMLWERRERQRKADKLASQIETWAQSMLQETEADGWKRVECNKMVRSSLNPDNRTVAFVKWMKDSREDQADPDDQQEYPCIKCYATIDAPLDAVCSYLADESVSPDYNDVVKQHHDLEEISLNAKVCWSQSPQILFIKPRDFVTFCHHRWKRDGTEVIVNQAVDHPSGKQTEESVRAYALRGANFISPSMDDPSKTHIAIITHANPGGGLPPWATKTAVNALAPIEPFKLFHKINEQVKRKQSDSIGHPTVDEAEMASSSSSMSAIPGRTRRPAGWAGLGYACYWPNGGGSVEGSRVTDGEHQSTSTADLEHEASVKEE